MKQSRFIDEQIIGFLKKADAGMSVKELCQSGGFNLSMKLLCCCVYTGVLVRSRANHMRALESINNHLK